MLTDFLVAAHNTAKLAYTVALESQTLTPLRYLHVAFPMFCATGPGNATGRSSSQSGGVGGPGSRDTQAQGELQARREGCSDACGHGGSVGMGRGQGESDKSSFSLAEILYSYIFLRRS